MGVVNSVAVYAVLDSALEDPTFSAQVFQGCYAPEAAAQASLDLVLRQAAVPKLKLILVGAMEYVGNNEWPARSILIKTWNDLSRPPRVLKLRPTGKEYAPPPT